MLYSSAASSSAFSDVHNAEVVFVEPAEMDGAEVNGPDSISDLLETDDFALEEGGDEDLSALPAHGVVTGDPAELEVGGVFERLGGLGEGTRRRAVDGGWGLHVQGLVGSLVVEDAAEPIEGVLLGTEVRARG
jgi:hypothetical protein